MRRLLALAAVLATGGAGSSAGRIAFSAGPLEPGKSDVYTVDADGSHLRNLTHGRGINFDPTWSPDGRLVAFRSIRGGNEEIRVVRADGTGERNLTRNPAMDYAPAWSPDGKRIAFASTRGFPLPHVWMMNVDATHAHVLTRAFTGEYPAWSPDGKRIAFATNVGPTSNGFEIVVVNVDGTRARRITRNDVNDMGPRWSPDGRWLAFQSNRAGGNLNDVFVMHPDGTGVRRVTRGGGELPAWSPDGRFIVYAAPGGLEIVRPDGTHGRRLRLPVMEPTFPDWIR